MIKAESVFRGMMGQVTLYHVTYHGPSKRVQMAAAVLPPLSQEALQEASKWETISQAQPKLRSS